VIVLGVLLRDIKTKEVREPEVLDARERNSNKGSIGCLDPKLSISRLIFRHVYIDIKKALFRSVGVAFPMQYLEIQ
jgi:hypothetical protein